MARRGRGISVVWRVRTGGTITGPGSKLKRIAVWDLTVAAEREEGIDS